MPTFRVADDVYGIDLQMFDTEVLSAFVIDAPEPTLIETGYANGVDRLLAALYDLEIPPTDVRHAIISHVHIDHSGGAGRLAAEMPELTVYIHESTADHLLDPSALTASSERAMGEHFEAFGGPDPVPPEVLEPVTNGATIDIGDRQLDLRHTPGHSPDHVAVWDASTGRLFANEAIGSYFPRAERWLPPATLPLFDVEAVESTLESLAALDPATMALSHFGCVSDPEAGFAAARAALREFDHRIPELYRELNDVDTVIEHVRRDLVELDDDYDAAIAAFEAGFQTRGFLHYHDLL